jgi:hypothetical protein
MASSGFSGSSIKRGAKDPAAHHFPLLQIPPAIPESSIPVGRAKDGIMARILTKRIRLCPRLTANFIARLWSEMAGDVRLVVS